MNILFLHGMAEGHLSHIAGYIQKHMPDDRVITPDLVINPDESFHIIDEILKDNKIDVVVGHSLGGFMAQKYRTMRKVLINPSLGMSYGYLCRFPLKYKYERYDGLTHFQFTTDDCRKYKSMEAVEFDNITEDERNHTIGLFGRCDILTRLSAHRFKKYYSQRTIIPGTHFPTEEVVKKFIVKVIRDIATK